MHKPNHNPMLVPLEVIRIASKVRKQCEQYVSMDSSGYFNEKLACFCAVGSGALFHALSKGGFKPLFVRGNYLYNGKDNWTQHCWVQLGDAIVDITATQFGELPEVLVCSLHDGHYYNLEQFDQWIEIQVALQNWDLQRPTKRKAIEILKIAA